MKNFTLVTCSCLEYQLFTPLPEPSTLAWLPLNHQPGPTCPLNPLTLPWLHPLTPWPHPDSLLNLPDLALTSPWTLTWPWFSLNPQTWPWLPPEPSTCPWLPYPHFTPKLTPTSPPLNFCFWGLFQSHLTWVQSHLVCSPPCENNIFHLMWKNS